MPDSRRTESIQGAIELLTLWLACPDGPPAPMLSALERHIAEHPSGDGLNGAVELIMGLIRVSGTLLVLREFESSIPAQQTIQALAVELAQAEDFESSMGTSDDHA
jgi:hypothetical protein